MNTRLIKKPIPKPRKHTHTVQTIHITTEQIQSVVGDQIDSKGNLVRRNYFCANHWIKGLHSTGSHRWRLGFAEVVYGDVETLQGDRAYTSDRQSAVRNGMELWDRLVAAVEPEFRQ